MVLWVTGVYLRGHVFAGVLGKLAVVYGEEGPVVGGELQWPYEADESLYSFTANGGIGGDDDD